MNFIIISSEDRASDIKTYTEKEILENIDCAYDSLNGNDLLYWFDIYSTIYGIIDIITS